MLYSSVFGKTATENSSMRFVKACNHLILTGKVEGITNLWPVCFVANIIKFRSSLFLVPPPLCLEVY